MNSIMSPITKLQSPTPINSISLFLQNYLAWIQLLVIIRHDEGANVQTMADSMH